MPELGPGGGTVGILHPGEMGAAVARCLRRRGLRVSWASEGRSRATNERADAAGFTGVYVDANAVAPETARRIAGLLLPATFVDGGIVGAPPTTPGTTRHYLSGDAAGSVQGLFSGTPLDARVVPGGAGAASAVKAAYAAWTKGSAALLLTARVEGVEATLLDQWTGSLPDLHERAALAERSAAARAGAGWARRRRSRPRCAPRASPTASTWRPPTSSATGRDRCRDAVP
ncbi:MAG: hypothetical protein J2P24_15685 [Streptosporangiales bacterium]|nr:hypothetical protein [Streptosporangiales bacterium]MBO0891606.1 hypothetical protein [Acidothermales bacterium]